MRHSALVMAIGLVGACSDAPSTRPTAPDLAGTWALTSVNGAPLPYTESTIGGTTQTIVGGRLRLLRGSGLGEFAFCRRTAPPGGALPFTEATVESVTYTVGYAGEFRITYRDVGARTGSSDVGTASEDTLAFQRTFEIPARRYGFTKRADDPFATLNVCP